MGRDRKGHGLRVVNLEELQWLPRHVRGDSNAFGELMDAYRRTHGVRGDRAARRVLHNDCGRCRDAGRRIRDLPFVPTFRATQAMS